jgi:DNA-binding MarR family transcriptional regulator
MQKGASPTFPHIFELGRILRSRMRVSLGIDCPSLPQLEVLEFVRDEETPTMRDIAGFLKVTAPSATSLVEELVAQGLMTRAPNPRDRREVRLALTGKGKSTLSRTTKRRNRVLASVLAPLGGRDKEEFDRLLKKIITHAK